MRSWPAFADAAQKAGIDIAVSDAIDLDRWQKFVFLVALSGVTAATRQPLGPSGPIPTPAPCSST